MNPAEKAQKIVSEIQYATIATADKTGRPWNTPVFFARDGLGNIYWSSHPESVHSKNIAHSGSAFIVIYNSKAGEGEGVGLYIQAAVTPLFDENEIKSALILIGDRRGKPFLHIRKFLDGGPQKIYKATPVHQWVNDADQDADGDFVRDYRVPVDD